jgi:hypothetical protein
MNTMPFLAWITRSLPRRSYFPSALLTLLPKRFSNFLWSWNSSFRARPTVYGEPDEAGNRRFGHGIRVAIFLAQQRLRR